MNFTYQNEQRLIGGKGVEYSRFYIGDDEDEYEILAITHIDKRYTIDISCLGYNTSGWEVVKIGEHYEASHEDHGHLMIIFSENDVADIYAQNMNAILDFIGHHDLIYIGENDM